MSASFPGERVRRYYAKEYEALGQARKVARPQHSIRAGRASKVPTRIIAFDTETHPCQTEPDYQDLTLGWAVFARADRDTREELFFTEPAKFWDFVASKVYPGTRLYVIAHNVFFDLRVVEWTKHLTAHGFDYTLAVTPDPTGPFHVEFFRSPGKGKKRETIIVTNLGNFYSQGSPLPLAVIGKAMTRAGMGFMLKGDCDATESRFWPYNGCAPGTADWEELSSYCRQDTYICLQAFLEWIRFISAHGLGSFALTISGQAFAAYKTRFMPTEIVVHNHTGALTLEREAYFGGLTDCFRVGKFTAPEGETFHKLDVNSMYPHVMRELEYPVDLVDYMSEEFCDEQPTKQLIEHLRKRITPGRAVIARISVDVPESSRDGAVPAYTETTIGHKTLMYPTGRFVTTVTTAELASALDAGVVTKVHAAAFYRAERIFHRYVDFFYNKRLEYKAEGNALWELLSKQFLNSLWGKFGQSNYDWESTSTQLDAEGIELITVLNDDGSVETNRVFRRIGSKTEVRSESKSESYDSCPSIAGHVSAYARHKLRSLRRTAGYDECFYADTDSLFTTNDGYLRLSSAGEIDDKRLGAMKSEATARTVVIHAPKDYMFGSVTKTKGIRADAEEIAPGVFRQVSFQGFAGALREDNLNRAKVTSVTRTPSHRYTKGVIGPDGWTRPLHKGAEEQCAI